MPSLKSEVCRSPSILVGDVGVCHGTSANAVFYKVERRLETGCSHQSGESEKVDKELAQRFSLLATAWFVVISGIPDPDSAESADALGFLTSSLRSVPGVSGAISSLDWPDPLFTGNDGGP